jgi:predicted TIM-barrel fold metal-dependent hydrolase
MNLNELRDKAYRNAVKHGWHEENLSNEHFLCLVISELMEAVEADRKGMHANRDNFEYYMKQRKRDDDEFIYAFKHDIKDSVEDELADTCIRLLDMSGLREYDLDSFDYEHSDTEDYSDMSFTESIFKICIYITDNFYRDEPFILLNEIFAFCRDRNIDIFWHIKQKVKYNELRPYKHGNKTY